MMAPRRGDILFDGATIGGAAAFNVLKRGIALVPEGRRLFPSLTVEENLLIGGQSRRPGPWTLERVLRAIPGAGRTPPPARTSAVRRAAADVRHRAAR